MGNSVGGQCAQAEQMPDKAGLTSSALPRTQPQILKISRSFGERKAPVAILRGMRQAGERGRWQLLSAAAAAKAAATGGQLQAGVAGGGPTRPPYMRKSFSGGFGPPGSAIAGGTCKQGSRARVRLQFYVKQLGLSHGVESNGWQQERAGLCMQHWAAASWSARFEKNLLVTST